MDFNGILTIRNVQPSDAGTYVCTGSNMFAMDQGTATLHVQGMPRCDRSLAPRAPPLAYVLVEVTLVREQTETLVCGDESQWWKRLEGEK